jgi:hypothetical protein
MDIDSLFNTFANNYLIIFHISFPLRKIIESGNNNYWIRTGIRISCKCKKHLCLLSRDSNDNDLKKYCKQYCRILSSVIEEAKMSMYNNQVTKSANKMKTIWNIIKLETNRLKGHTINKYQNSPDAFNKYFLSTAAEIIQDIRSSNIKGSSNNRNPKYYLSKLSCNSFPNIKFNNTATKETERIIKSLRLKNSHG